MGDARPRLSGIPGGSGLQRQQQRQRQLSWTDIHRIFSRTMVAQEAIDPLRIVCRIIGAPGADNYFGAAVESAKSWSKFPGRLIKRREIDARFSSLAEEESLSRNETE